MLPSWFSHGYFWLVSDLRNIRMTFSLGKRHPN